MGLLMSDTMLADPLPDETLRLCEGPGVWAYALDAVTDPYDYEAAAPNQ